MILCIILAILFVGVALFLKYSRKGSGPNPFSVHHVQKTEPVCIDRDLRKEVLKRRFDPQKVPDNLDAIVIGSGAGGLGAAAILSKAGWKVMVLEQHGKLGGCCHTFTKNGREFDVGIHYIGEMGPSTLLRNLSDQVTNGQLEWIPLNATYDNVVMRDTNTKIPVSDRNVWIKQLKEEFPDETANIDAFFAQLESEKGIFTPFILAKVLPLKLAQFLIGTGILQKMAPKFYTGVKETVWDVVCRYTDNPRLRTVLVYLFMDYGTNPERASWIMHSVILRHYKYGAFYPRGGASEIPFTMIPVVEESGGVVMARAMVEQILIDQRGKACGVRVNKRDIYAKVIVSDAGVINTFGKLLPREIASKSRYVKYMSNVGSGESVMQVFVGLKGSSEELGLKATNYWVYSNGSTWNDDLKKFLGRTLDETLEAPETEKIPLMFVSFPSAKDPTWEQKYPGTSVAIVCGPARYDWFTDWKEHKVKKRGDDYEYKKNVLGHKIWNQATELFPNLADKVETIQVGTPLTNSHYLGAPSGEIYGLDHGKARFSPEVVVGLRPDTDVPGLYLTGQDIACCGFGGALMGGLLCASKLLNRNLLNDLIKVKNERNKIK